MSLGQALAPLVDMVFPPRCPLCGVGLGAQSGLCMDCWGQLLFPGRAGCALCQQPIREYPGARPTCEHCRNSPPLHDGIAAATLYNEASRKLVLAFKRGRQIALAPMLARLMAARLAKVEGDWLVVPVPLHRWRLWSRGFNQSALLAREISRITGARLVVDGLLRLRHTKSLGALGVEERARMLEGAIGVNPRRAGIIQGARVVLVDDVLTTGATSNACVLALRQAGAASVVLACFARVIDEPPEQG